MTSKPNWGSAKANAMLVSTMTTGAEEPHDGRDRTKVDTLLMRGKAQAYSHRQRCAFASSVEFSTSAGMATSSKNNAAKPTAHTNLMGSRQTF